MIDKDKIIEGIKKAKERGFLLLPHVPKLTNTNCGCALTLAALGNDLVEPEVAQAEMWSWHMAGDLLNLTDTETNALADGFDGSALSDRHEANSSFAQALLFGKSLRVMIDLAPEEEDTFIWRGWVDGVQYQVSDYFGEFYVERHIKEIDDWENIGPGGTDPEESKAFAKVLEAAKLSST